LNTVFLGLKLSTGQIPLDTTDSAEKERLQTLEEIASATEAALDILNELLLYDKIQKDMLALNKQDVQVQDLVNISIKMFAVQLREKSMTFRVDFEAPDQSINQSSAILAKNNSISPKSNVNLDMSTSTILKKDSVVIDRRKIE
jgi:signal transduction histidine kinase